ncbi:MAG: zinc ABC transporter substrate-binding protein [Deltaproteobacteria bacterium]|nr:zinc ABC transporter substrate-binding protein [Deltaproteobacteria bacterium]
MKKTVIIISLVLISVVILILFGNVTPHKGTEKQWVAASFYPLAHFAGMAGGEEVEVYNVTPAGAESHDFEPTPQDIKRVRSSRLFIYNGAGFDPWAEKLAASLEKSGVVTLNISERFDLLSHAEGEGRDGHDDHEEGATDPHIWLDPLLAVKEVEAVRDAMIKTEPAKEERFKENAGSYIKKLHELHESYEKGLKDCKKRDVIVSHNAFGYLARRYGLNIIPVTGLSPAEEPSPRRMGEIARLAREKEIEFIFFETLVSPKIAETIAREIGAKTLVLNPLEGLTEKEMDSGEDYISVMRKNLDNIRTALSCR